MKLKITRRNISALLHWHKGILACLAMATLFSCSSDDSSDLEPGDPVLKEIQLTTGIGTITSLTRGDGIIKNDLTANLPVSFVRVDCESGGSYPADYTGIGYLDAEISKTGNKVSFTTPQYYLTDGGTSKFISWYPQATSTVMAEDTKVRWDAATGTVNFPAIDGSTDILVSSTIEGSKTDLIGDNRKVTYAHVLTQIFVYISAEENTIDTWGTIHSIALADKKQSGVLTLPLPQTATGATATTTFQTTGATDLPLVKTDNSGAVSNVTLTDTETLTGYAMFAPHQTTSDELVLKINTEKGGMKEVSIDYDEMNLKAGLSYNVKLQFKANSITPTASIEEWRMASEAEQPDPVIVE